MLDEIERLEFDEIRMHGVVAKRTARHFGLDSDYERRTPLEDAEPIPEWLLPVRTAAAELAGLAPDELVEVLVQRYPEGAQIGWHRDAAKIRGPARDLLRLRPRRPGAGPRSSTASRRRRHFVYSTTFRTLRKRDAQA